MSLQPDWPRRETKNSLLHMYSIFANMYSILIKKLIYSTSLCYIDSNVRNIRAHTYSTVELYVLQYLICIYTYSAYCTGIINIISMVRCGDLRSQALALSHSHTPKLSRSHTHNLSHSQPLALSHSQTLTLPDSQPLALSHWQALTLRHSQPPALSHSQSLALSDSQALTLPLSQPLALSHSQALTLPHSQPLALSHSQPLTLSH